jgi:hypothetical protein
LYTFLRNTAFVTATISALAFFVSLFAYKRADVSWLSFLGAGPMTVLRPSRYLRANRSSVPPLLLSIAMLLFAIAWVTSWFVDNS